MAAGTVAQGGILPPGIYASGEKTVSFAISDIFKLPNRESRIPVQNGDVSGHPKIETVDSNHLLEFIREYPEPITLEIENFDRVIFSPASEQAAPGNQPVQQSAISFSFDLRDVVKVASIEPRAITGILVITNYIISTNSEQPRRDFELKPRSRIRQRANAIRQARAIGKFDMAVSPDQYGLKKIRLLHRPLDIKESDDIPVDQDR
jgi:hypothetical protein